LTPGDIANIDEYFDQKSSVNVWTAGADCINLLAEGLLMALPCAKICQYFLSFVAASTAVLATAWDREPARPRPAIAIAV